MSRYSDLRWKISDLEKQLEEEKICAKKAWEQVEHYIRVIYAKDKTIEELKRTISAVKRSDNNAERIEAFKG